MSNSLLDRVHSSVSKRSKDGLLRELRILEHSAIDFSSNDYLGLKNAKDYQLFVKEFLKDCQPRSLFYGSTGSRLLTGHSEEVEYLERVSAEFHGMPEALFFNSGYDANISILSCLPGPNDVIIFDELVHASMHDGMRMSRAKHRLYSFKHNDVFSLKKVVRDNYKSNGSVIICMESVYSMDGDLGIVKDVLSACKMLQDELLCEIHLIVDEAHGGGIIGKKGQGLVSHENLCRHRNLLATIITFGKAFCAHGAMILCQSSDLKNYLINYSRPLIYSTALPPHSVLVLQATYKYMETEQAHNKRERLNEIISFFQMMASRHLPSQMLMYNFIDETIKSRFSTPIQAVVVPGNRRCIELTNILRGMGFFVYPIRSPTVPKGFERIRIVLHSSNTREEVESLIITISKSIFLNNPMPML